MSTGGIARYRAIDGLRALSIVWMVCFHTIYFIGVFDIGAYRSLARHAYLTPFIEGHFGVDVFFVISGFLIASLLFQERERTGGISLRAFYLRRAFRILPLYVVALVIAALLLRVNASSAWSNLLFVNNFLPLKKQFMGWTWSLAIEEQFYLCFPLALMFAFRLTRNLWPFFVATLLGGLAITAFLVHRYDFHRPIPAVSKLDPELYYRWFDLVYDKTYTRFTGIVWGIVATYRLHTRGGLRASHATHLGLACAIAILASLTLTPTALSTSPSLVKAYLATYRFVFAGAVAWVVFYAVSLPGSALERFLGHPAWRPIAELSYGAYLIHPVVITVVYRTLRLPSVSVPTFFGLMGLNLVATFAIAWVLHRVVEHPARELGRRLAARPTKS